MGTKKYFSLCLIQLVFLFASFSVPVLSLECVVCEGIAGDASNTWSGKCYRTPQDKHFVSKCKDAREDVCVKYYTTNSNDATLNSVRRWVFTTVDIILQ